MYEKVPPQMNSNLSELFQRLPLANADQLQCVVGEATQCLCDQCTIWYRILSWDFERDHEAVMAANSHILVWAFDSKLIVNNIALVSNLFKNNFRTELTDIADRYLTSLRERGQVFVGVHVRRTDYIRWIRDRYGGAPVQPAFFRRAFRIFRQRFSASLKVLFVLTTDDVEWSESNLGDKDVVIATGHVSLEANAFLDLIVLSRCNHTVYDMGSFGFWAGVLAGGDVILADGYSQWDHPLVSAIRDNPPPGWSLLNVNNISG